MKKYSLLIIIIILLGCNKNESIAAKETKEVHCRGFDYSKYDTCEYYDNYYLVKKNKKKNLVDGNGRELFDSFYDQITIIKNTKKFIVKKNSKYGLLDNKGKLLIPFQYDNINSGLEDALIVSSNNKRGIVDYNNTKILNTVYDEISPYYLTVKLDNKMALIDKSGKLTSPFFKNDYKYISPIRGSNGYRKVAKKLGRNALMNPKGEVVTPFIYPEIKHFVNGLFKTEKTVWEDPVIPENNEPVMMHGHQVTGLIDKNGKEIVSLELGGAIIRLLDWLDKKVVYIRAASDKFYDLDGNFLFKFKKGIHIREKIEYMSDKTPFLYARKRSKKYGDIKGIIDLNGKEILPFKYGSIYYKNGYFKVSRLAENGYGLVNNKGRRITEIKYVDISFYNGMFYLRDKNKNLGRLNSNAKVLVPCKYKVVFETPSKNGLFLVANNRKGFDDSRVVFYDSINQKEIYHELEDSVEVVRDFFEGTNLLSIRKDGKVGVVNQEFKTVIPFEYDKVHFLKNKKDFLGVKGDVKSYFTKIGDRYGKR